MALSLFNKILVVGDNALFKTNGESAVFAYNSLASSANVLVIFDRSKEVIVMEGENGVVANVPVASIRHSELNEKSLPRPVEGDQLTVQETVYDVELVLDDGHNVSELHLEKA